MSEFRTPKYDDVMKKAFDEAVKETVENLFKDRWGYNDGAQIVAALRTEAERILREDPKVRDRLKRRLIALIEHGEAQARS